MDIRSLPKPDKTVENQLASVGIYIIDDQTLDKFEGKFATVRVLIGIPEEVDAAVPSFSISRVSKSRGTALVCTDWKMEFNEETQQKNMTFTAAMRIPEGQTLPSGDFENQAMTFVNLCWYAGNEEISDLPPPDTFTKLPSKYNQSDLGWILSSRFADTLIYGLGAVNDSILMGLLEESILLSPSTYVSPAK